MIRRGLPLLLFLLPWQAVQAQAPIRGVVPQDRPDQRPAPHGARAHLKTPLPRQQVGAPIRSFVLSRVEVEGSSLPASAFAAAWAPFVGKSVDAATLQSIVDTLAQVYARSDIALYTVLAPPQDYAGGVLRLTAQEGYVEAAVVRGAGARMRHLAGRYCAPILRERPLHKATLQRYVSLIRDINGLNPTVNFERGDRSGAVKLVVLAHPQPFQVAFGINNRGTALLGKTQAEVDGIANSLLTGGDQLRLSYARPVAGPYYQSLSGAYAVPLDADGLGLLVNAGRIRTRPRDLDLRGRATSLGGQLTYAAVRDFKSSLVLGAGLDGVNSDNAFLGFAISNERTRALRLSATFTRSGEHNQFGVSATQSFGLNALGARVLDPSLSTLAFRKTNLRLADTQALGKTFLLRVNGAAQMTGDRLPATEQFTLGGDDFGRAYETALISGDSGYAGSAELAARPAGLPSAFTGSEIYGFVDGGHVHYRARAGFAPVDNHLGSWGGGARLTLIGRVQLQIEAAKGMNDPVTYEDRRKWRLITALRSVI